MCINDKYRTLWNFYNLGWYIPSELTRDVHKELLTFYKPSSSSYLLHAEEEGWYVGQRNLLHRIKNMMDKAEHPLRHTYCHLTASSVRGFFRPAVILSATGNLSWPHLISDCFILWGNLVYISTSFNFSLGYIYIYMLLIWIKLNYNWI